MSRLDRRSVKQFMRGYLYIQIWLSKVEQHRGKVFELFNCVKLRGALAAYLTELDGSLLRLEDVNHPEKTGSYEGMNAATLSGRDSWSVHFKISDLENF